MTKNNYKIKFKTIVLICFIVINSLVAGQNCFVLNYGHINCNEFPMDVIEFNNSYYLISSLIDSNNLNHLVLYRFTQSGDISIKTSIAYQNFLFSYEFLPSTYNSLSLAGYKYDMESYKNCSIEYIEFDTSLCITKHISHPESSYMLSKNLLFPFNEYYIQMVSGIDSTNIYPDWDILLYKFNLNGGILQKNKIGINGTGDRIFAGTPYPDRDSCLILSTGISSNPGLKFAIIDSCLNLKTFTPNPASGWGYQNIVFNSDSTFLISASCHSPDNLTGYGISLFDTNFNILADHTIWHQDTLLYPGYTKNLGLSGERIYCGYTKNHDRYSVYANQNTWIALAILNDSLQVIFQRYYGGDANYGLWNLLNTQDGGCLLAGTKYKWENNDYDRDLILIKTDENGLITSTGPGPSIQARDAIVYPNPGRERLTIERGPQIAGAKFVLYDMAGKTLIEKTLNHTTETLPTAHLPAGLYLWNITHKGKAVENGKWVKE